MFIVVELLSITFSANGIVECV